jgi:drug/metabolite transporter (DMT)-like permease
MLIARFPPRLGASGRTGRLARCSRQVDGLIGASDWQQECTIEAGPRRVEAAAAHSPEPFRKELIVRAPSGAAPALASAALFGASTPLAKLLLEGIDPLLLAGLLYLGSGIGLALVQALTRFLGRRTPGEAPLRRGQWLRLGLAIVFGGVLAPGLLMYGLASTSAAAAALLLNLEPIFTVLLAWLVFGEAIGARIALGMTAIAAGALALSWQGGNAVGSPVALAAIALACLGWAVDNNLTRKIALADPVQIAALKGAAAGMVNVALALSAGSSVPPAETIGAAALVGFVGYGASLVLFVRALRAAGAARTGAYFSLAPFFGGVLSMALFGEAPSIRLGAAGLLMALGVGLHLTERHEHEHEHRGVEHDHSHAHDEHHPHEHGGGEPHALGHVHDRLTHRHPHFPDAHHEHPH